MQLRNFRTQGPTLLLTDENPGGPWKESRLSQRLASEARHLQTVSQVPLSESVPQVDPYTSGSIFTRDSTTKTDVSINLPQTRPGGRVKCFPAAESQKKPSEPSHDSEALTTGQITDVQHRGQQQTQRTTPKDHTSATCYAGDESLLVLFSSWVHDQMNTHSRYILKAPNVKMNQSINADLDLKGLR